MAHDYFTDERTFKHAFIDIKQELHELPKSPAEAEWSRIQRVNHRTLRNVGLGDMRLLLNALSLAARSQHDGHAYQELYSQLAREHYYPALDATNAVIDSLK